MVKNRSKFERIAARIIDWLIRKLTPNTWYYNIETSPFQIKDHKENRKIGGSAAIYLCCHCYDNNCIKLVAVQNNVTYRGKDIGNWKVTVELLSQGDNTK